jgi:hypothetical protein
MKITIPFHSFSDCITNSSSETYISATSSTVSTVHQIVNSLLKMSGSTSTSEELFSVSVNGDDLEITVLGGLDSEKAQYAQVAAKELMSIVSTYEISAEYNG